MEKIILLMGHAGNRRLLGNFLSRKFEVLSSDKINESNISADLIIVDDLFLSESSERLKKIKEDAKPYFLPFLLITSPQELKTNLYQWQIIDEFIKTPVEKMEFQVRVESLLRIRKLSVESEQRYYTLAENSPVAICILHEGKIVYANPVLTGITGKTKEELTGEPFINFIYSEDRETVLDFYNNCTTGKADTAEALEARIHSPGEVRWLELRLSEITYKEKTSIMINAPDVTERKEQEEKISYLTFHDTVTGLYNRAYFKEELNKLDKERHLPLSIIMGDVNNLKIVNDAFGHQEGDRLILKAADIFKTCCRKDDIVARWGGDEFIALLPNTGTEEAQQICEKIRKVGGELKDTPMQPSIALGVASKEDTGTKINEVINTAEDRMYRNKLTESKSGRNTIVVSMETMLQEKSNETDEHAQRLKKLSFLIGNTLKLPENMMDELTLLSRLHDIGKVAIPEYILKKPDKLNLEEWRIIKKHPEIGYRIVKSIPELAHVADAILYHHERWDGKGYPWGLKGEQIPLISRIISVVDAYDVMTSERPYKKPLSQVEAINELKRCSGTQFDPYVTNAFIKSMSQSVNVL